MKWLATLTLAVLIGAWVAMPVADALSQETVHCCCGEHALKEPCGCPTCPSSRVKGDGQPRMGNCFGGGALVWGGAEQPTTLPVRLAIVHVIRSWTEPRFAPIAEIAPWPPPELPPPRRR